MTRLHRIGGYNNSKNLTCNCLEKTLEKTIEFKKEQEYNVLDADWLNKGWNFSGIGNPINLYNEIKISYDFIKVNGERSKPKSETISIYGEYCTFCGKKFKEE